MRENRRGGPRAPPLACAPEVAAVGHRPADPSGRAPSLAGSSGLSAIVPARQPSAWSCERRANRRRYTRRPAPRRTRRDEMTNTIGRRRTRTLLTDRDLAALTWIGEMGVADLAQVGTLLCRDAEPVTMARVRA